jgi:hypothetical protein
MTEVASAVEIVFLLLFACWCFARTKHYREKAEFFEAKSKLMQKILESRDK